MNYMSRIRKLAVIAAAAFIIPATLVHGDDTEIYTTPNQGEAVRPNIIFIIDTSASMSSVVGTRETYNPFYTYGDDNNDGVLDAGKCSPDKIYWDPRGQTPDCTTTNNWFYADQNKCQGAIYALGSNTNASGVYQGRLAMFNNQLTTTLRDWTTFDPVWKDHPVECESDFGVHGDGIDDASKWPVRTMSTPWTSGTDNRINWRRTGGTYTLYSGNYLNWAATIPNTPRSRLDIVKEAFRHLIMTIDANGPVNMALMRWDEKGNGGYLLTPMLPVNDVPVPEWDGMTTRDYFSMVVSDLGWSGNVTLAETLYEAKRYFAGEAPVWGASHYSGGEPFLSAEGNYISPALYQCQKNFIVVLTADSPMADGESDADIVAMNGFPNLIDSVCDYPDDDCADELAEYMFKTDFKTVVPSLQNVITYTVGFVVDQPLLKDIARKGRGRYILANDTLDLQTAFTGLMSDIMGINTTFAAPAVTVNAFNRLTHRSELYFALFQPAERPRWPGNIKRYKLGRADAAGQLSVLDVNGNLAVDPATGFFKTTSKSWWSVEIDGDDVRRGGAAGMHTKFRATYSDILGAAVLTQNGNALNESNPVLNASLLGSPPPDIIDDLLMWTRGLDVLDEDVDGITDEARNYMGDPLHTQPVLVTYGVEDIVLYGTTNEGFLHAVDTDDGKEYWAYMPKDLLKNLYMLYQNLPTDPVQKVYGLDGPLALWITDNDKDGLVEKGDGDKVVLYVSQRLGGKNIYSVDVTDRYNPVYKWVIKGGSTGFQELNYTWSKPTVAKVAWTNGTTKTVLIFGGGYDTGQETVAAGTDDEGRGIFMVDADTGTLLWSAGPTNSKMIVPEMQYSVPSEIRVLDLNSNGLADLMYVGDMGGQVWQFDFNPAPSSDADFASGGVIAKLGDYGIETGIEHKRRFFYPPDVSISSDWRQLNIAIGSGHRGRPLDTTIHDRFFVLHQDVASIGYAADKVYVAKTITDLYNYRTPDPSTCALKAGFYFDLNGYGWMGEKVLAESVTLNHEVNFTTFSPAQVEVDPTTPSCSAGQGEGKLYRLDIPEIALCASATEVEEIHLDQPSIPPAPQPICTTDGCTVLVGPQAIESSKISRTPKKFYWRNN